MANYVIISICRKSFSVFIFKYVFISLFGIAIFTGDTKVTRFHQKMWMSIFRDNMLSIPNALMINNDTLFTIRACKVLTSHVKIFHKCFELI
ncbi:hypothetical protein HMPREF0880_01430 [Yokenella regensburgei ATCC 43003]|nr:hypothetical protein HMPREF0880_01430 [Yokenella regensburgei ATCC 43003]